MKNIKAVHLPSAQLIDIIKTDVNTPYTLGLLPKIGIPMLMKRRHSNQFDFSCYGITIADLRIDPFPPNKSYVIKPAKLDEFNAAIPRHGLANFYPVIDAIGLRWLCDETDPISVKMQILDVPNDLFCGLGTLGVTIKGTALGLFKTSTTCLAAVLIRVGCALGVVVVHDILAGVMYVLMVSLKDHPPLKLVELLGQGEGALKSLQSIAKGVRSKHINPKHSHYLKDWE
ncbi:MAG: hypothetical protein RR280_10465 [Bacteroidaceae bacterium]